MKLMKALLTALLTAALLALALAIFFLPGTFYVVARSFPHATTWYLWQNFATMTDIGDLPPMEFMYLGIVLVVGAVIWVFTLLGRAIWEWLS